MKPDVVIAGGGIAGLTAAYDLARQGIDCLLFEAADRLGGLIHTTESSGFLMDAGPDAFLVQKPHAKELCDELGLSDELVPTNQNPAERKVYVLYRGALRAMPEGMRLTVPTRALPLWRSDLFSVRGRLRLLMEPLVPARRGSGEESIASFVRRRFGEEALERLGEPLLAGIHCGDPEKLSMTQLFPRLVELEARYGSVTRGMLKASGSGEGAMFLSLASGMGRLVDRLRTEIPAEAIRLGCAVTRVAHGGEGFEVELATGERVACRSFISALPLTRAAALLEAAAPGLAAALRRIPMVSTAVAFLGFRRDAVAHPLDGYGFVVPAAEPNRLLAATFVTTKLPGRAPEGCVLFRAFLGGTKDPGALGLADRELVALAREELGRALGVSLGEPLLERLVRWDRRTPQIELGHHAILEAFERERSGLPGLYVLANGLAGVGIPDSIRSARACARAVRDFLQTDR